MDLLYSTATFFGHSLLGYKVAYQIILYLWAVGSLFSPSVLTAGFLGWILCLLFDILELLLKRKSTTNLNLNCVNRFY